MNRRVEFWKVVGICAFASICYGILHDQITARVCLEYFTVFHPPLVEVEDPTVQALAWGIAATWWMGAFLGAMIGASMTTGLWPALPARWVLRPLVSLLVVMAISALLAGMAGWRIGEPIASMAIQVGSPHPKPGQIRTPRPRWIDEEPWIPQNRARPFAADLAAHNASYFVGFWGGLGVAVYAVLMRRKIATRGPAMRVKLP